MPLNVLARETKSNVQIDIPTNAYMHHEQEQSATSNSKQPCINQATVIYNFFQELIDMLIRRPGAKYKS
jgi:hypothetical protein